MRPDDDIGSTTRARRRVVAATFGLLLLPRAGAQGAAPDAALIEAAEAGDVAEVRRLLARGASVKARDATGPTALVAATWRSSSSPSPRARTSRAPTATAARR